MTESRQGWGYEIVKWERHGGFEQLEVRFWFTHARQLAGEGLYVIDGQPCDLMNNFKMQIRETHQRVVLEPGDLASPEGYMRHNSGLVIPRKLRRAELANFLTGQGLALGGYDPFHFPSYEGADELLDGMWQHEQHNVPLLRLATRNIEDYIDVAIRLGLRGDERGTTLNLQIGASADDAEESAGTGNPSFTGNNINFGKFGSVADHVGLRFTGVTGMSGATVSAAPLTFEPSAVDTADFIGDWFAHDVAAPLAFTTDNENITSRTRTTATCEGDGADFGNWATDTPVVFIGDGVNTIATVLQEIANDHDPSALVLVHIYTSGDGERVFDAYDLSTEDAVMLALTLTPGGPGAPEFMSAMQPPVVMAPIPAQVVGY